MVAATVLAGGMYLYRQHAQAALKAEHCASVAAARGHLLAEGQGANVAVLGDSYAQGTGIAAGASGAFPKLLSQQIGEPIQVDGEGSTGFTTDGYCAGQSVTYGDRLHGDGIAGRGVIVVEGGVNDVLTGNPTKVGRAASEVLAALDSSHAVVVVGPPAITAAKAADVRTVDQQLAAATQAAGRVYVSLIGARISLGPDGIHPTQAGQRQIADLIAAALR